MAGLVTLEDIEKAIETIKRSPMVHRTPLLKNVEGMFGFAGQFKLHLKMESMQNTGTYMAGQRGTTDPLESHTG